MPCAAVRRRKIKFTAMPGPPVSIRQCQFSRCGRAFSREAGARGAAMLRRHADAEGRMHRSTEPSCRPSASAHRAKNAHPFALARAQELPVQSSRAQLTSRPRESIRARLCFAPAPPPGQRPRVCADHLPVCSQPHRHHVAGHPFEYVQAEDCLPRGMALPRRQLAVPTHNDDAGGGLGFELHSAGPLALALACPLYYRKRDHHHHHQDPGTKAPTNKLWASVPYGASTQALHMPVTGHASFRIGLPAILRSALVGSQTVAATSGSPPALDIRLAAGPDLMHRPMSLARSLPPWLGWLSQHSTARYGAMATTRSLEKHVPELPAVLGCPSRLPPAAHVSATKPLLPLGWFHPSCLELSCGGGLELPRE